MLSQFRALAKSPVAKVLIFLVMASVLATFALRGVNSVVQGDSVIQAGSRSVSSARFKQMFDDELKQYNQQSGQTVTAQDALAHGVDRQVADSIAADESFAEYLNRSGVRPSDKLIIDEIRKAPRFFNAVSGRFDRQAYEQFVQQIGMTDSEFEGVLRDQLAQTQFVSGVAAGMRAPLLYSALQAAYTAEGRTFSYFVLGPNAVPAPATPTDAQLTAFLKQNAQPLPESRVFTLVRFSTAQQALKTTADPAAVQKRFDFEKDSLSTPEKRSVMEIPVHDAATATAVAARLKKGEDPSLVAKSINAQLLNYPDTPKSAIADRKIADLAFTMTDGEVRGPVQGDLGTAVLKLVKTTPGHVATLEEQRAKLETEVKHDAAQTMIDKQVQKYEDTRSGGSTMLQAAKALGVATSALPAITAQGMTPTLQPQRIPLPPKLLQAGFALTPGADSDLVDLGQGEYAALHLEKVNPPAPPPLDAIRPVVTRAVMQRDLMTRLQTKADAIVAQMKKGQTIEAAAAAAGAGATLGHGVGVQRQAADQTFSNELLSRIFQAKPGDVITGPDVKKVGVLIAKVQGPVPASGKDVSQSAANLRRGASQSVVQDLAAALRTAARDIVKPKIDYKRARAALGGAPSQGQ